MKKLTPRRIAVALIAFTSALSSTIPAALAQFYSALPAAGVQKRNRHGARTTFLSTEPAYNRNFTYQLNPGRSRVPYIGVNLPALGESLPNTIGDFIFFTFWYEVPNAGPRADSGLTYFLQTNDGFLHRATGTALLQGPVNGVNMYAVNLFSGQFSPVINVQPGVPGGSPGGSVNNLSIRYSNSPAGTIYSYFAEIYGLGLQDYELRTLKTVNDTEFNN